MTLKNMIKWAASYVDDYAPADSYDVQELISLIAGKLDDPRVSIQNKIVLSYYYERLSELMAIYGRSENYA